MSEAARRDWERKAELKRLTQSFPIAVDVQPDGSFRADDVPAGRYRLNLSASAVEPGGYFMEHAGFASIELTVPGPSDGQSDEPIDLGRTELAPLPRLARGEPVPGFTVKGLDGKPIELDDFRGRHVLLLFWSAQSPNQFVQFDEVRAVYDRFGDEPERLVILGINTDPSDAAARRHLASGPHHWTQGFSGGTDKLPAQYFRSPAAMFLIGPDGKLIEKNLTGRAAFGVLDQVLTGKGEKP